MKFYAILLTVFLSLLILLPESQVNAQDKTGLNYGHVITVDPLFTATGPYANFHTNYTRIIFNIGYEHRLSKLNSFTVNTALHLVSNDEIYRIFSLGGSYRWYIDLFNNLLNDGKQPIEGLSVGPTAMIQLRVDNPDKNYVTTTTMDPEFDIGIGGEAAYKFIFSDFVVEPVIRLLIGLPDMTDFHVFSLGLNVGYAW